MVGHVVSRVAHAIVKLGPTDSACEVYGGLAERMPHNVPFALGMGSIRDLRQELHSWERVWDWVSSLAIRLDRPILVNIPFKDGSSQTQAIAPPTWSRERLAGYIAGHHDVLEAEFGPIGRLEGLWVTLQGECPHDHTQMLNELRQTDDTGARRLAQPLLARALNDQDDAAGARGLTTTRRSTQRTVMPKPSPQDSTIQLVPPLRRLPLLIARSLPFFR
jgi:hypothetical protein